MSDQGKPLDQPLTDYELAIAIAFGEQEVANGTMTQEQLDAFTTAELMQQTIQETKN